MFSSRKTTAPSSGGYNLTKSLRFRSSATAYLNRTFGTPTNNLKWTYSGWVKRGSLGSISGYILSSALGGASTFFVAGFSSDQFYVLQVTSGTTTGTLLTNALYRDPAAWYHVVIVWDSANATAANRILLYINGTQVTSFASTTNPSSSLACSFNLAGTNAIGYNINSSNSYLDGYLSEVNFIDGQALTPSSFGSTNALTGVWQPAKYTGTYGTNGFYLPFTNITSTSTLGNDSSGNGNNWTTNNISLTAGSTYDSMYDVPTLTSATVANYCVLNPLNNLTTLTNGNLSSSTGSAAWIPVVGSMGVSSGKWYWETTVLGTTDVFVGIFPFTYYATSGVYPGNLSSSGYGYYGANGNKYNLGAGGVAYGASFTTNDVIGVALDLTAGTLTYYKNNTSQGTAATGITGTWLPALAVYSSSAALNFGQQPFVYTPPTGFVALNTYNL